METANHESKFVFYALICYTDLMSELPAYIPPEYQSQTVHEWRVEQVRPKTAVFTAQEIQDKQVSVIDLGNGQVMLAGQDGRQEVRTRRDFLSTYAPGDKISDWLVQASAAEDESDATQTSDDETKDEIDDEFARQLDQLPVVDYPTETEEEKHEALLTSIQERIDRNQHPERYLGESIKYLFDNQCLLSASADVPVKYLEKRQPDIKFDFDTVEQAQKLSLRPTVDYLVKTPSKEIRQRFGNDMFFQLMTRETPNGFYYLDGASVLIHLQRLTPSQAVRYYGDSEFFRLMVEGNSDYSFFLAAKDQLRAEMPKMV